MPFPLLSEALRLERLRPLRPPTGSGNDWVLVLAAAAKGYPAPGRSSAARRPE